jgi:kynurenine--oxoglutarate transaminase/cysteine-S-conjugate beta-lyase/glutamine--phenylpyruvate transaminase
MKKTIRRPFLLNFRSISRRMDHLTESIWTEYTGLSIKHGSINLGQGFPDWNTPQFVLDEAKKAFAIDIPQQYCRAKGHPILVDAIANFYKVPQDQILVTNGASGAFNCLMQSLINDGDEVILFEPFYDIYPAQTYQAGGIPIFCPMHMGKTTAEWTIDFEKLRKTITKKTKVIVFNNPHNPTGKCFSKAELSELAKICIDFDLKVISDEVYEFMNFNAEHQRLKDLPGMQDRCITMYSAGKTFSVTGWKIGWIVGPKELVYNAYLINQYTVFSVCTPLQVAVGKILSQDLKPYFKELNSDLVKKSNFLHDVLTEHGLSPMKPDAGYFTLCKLKSKTDLEFSRWLPEHVGVSCIPLTPFYSQDHKKYAEKYVRFCFAKKDSTLEAAKQNFKRLKVIDL